MSEDIVARLRGIQSKWMDPIYSQAADEIESLRKELEECKAELERQALEMRAEGEYRDYWEDTSK